LGWAALPKPVSEYRRQILRTISDAKPYANCNSDRNSYAERDTDRYSHANGDVHVDT